MWRRSISRQDI